MIKKMLAVISFVILLTGCNTSDTRPSEGQKTFSEYKVNGMDPKEAFSQFTFYKTGSCEEGNMKYRYISIYNPSRNTTDSELGLFLREDGEARIYNPYNGIHETTWRIDGTQLVVENFGSASYITSNDIPTLKFKMHDNSDFGQVLLSKTHTFDQAAFAEMNKDADYAKERCQKMEEANEEIFSLLANF